jgi:hypothetical protein
VHTHVQRQQACRQAQGRQHSRGHACPPSGARRRDVRVRACACVLADGLFANDPEGATTGTRAAQRLSPHTHTRHTHTPDTHTHQTHSHKHTHTHQSHLPKIAVFCLPERVLCGCHLALNGGRQLRRRLPQARVLGRLPAGAVCARALVGAQAMRFRVVMGAQASGCRALNACGGDAAAAVGCGGGHGGGSSRRQQRALPRPSAPRSAAHDHGQASPEAPPDARAPPARPAPPPSLAHRLTSGLKASSGGRASLLSAHMSWCANRSLPAAAVRKKLTTEPSAWMHRARHGRQEGVRARTHARMHACMRWVGRSQQTGHCQPLLGATRWPQSRLQERGGGGGWVCIGWQRSAKRLLWLHHTHAQAKASTCLACTAACPSLPLLQLARWCVGIRKSNNPRKRATRQMCAISPHDGGR